jgi:hypothetical protein
MGNLASLQKRMYERAEKVGQVGNEAKKHAARSIVRYLVNITPVDTSQALSNWQARNDFPVSFTVSPYFLGQGGSTQGQSAQAAYDEANAIISKAKPGEPIYLSNVLPYIKRLDEGSSTQHPGGFVHASVIVGRVSLRNFKYDWK